MNEAQQIRIAYPSEPDWKVVSEAVLVELVQSYQDEPSCAQSAITELKSRHHPRTEELCLWLLSSESTDKWLRAGALGILLSLNPMEGLNKALPIIDDCEFELLNEVVEALNYEHQGSLSGLVHAHPIVVRVRARLLQGTHQAPFGRLFLENFSG
jgi:hypothetical protein